MHGLQWGTPKSASRDATGFKICVYDATDPIFATRSDPLGCNGPSKICVCYVTYPLDLCLKLESNDSCSTISAPPPVRRLLGIQFIDAFSFQPTAPEVCANTQIPAKMSVKTRRSLSKCACQRHIISLNMISETRTWGSGMCVKPRTS